MDAREVGGGIQLTVAGFGAVMFVVAGWMLWGLGGSPESSGHMAGFAVALAAIVGWCGLLLVGIGLLIPAGEQVGITFSRGQRYCFLASTACTLGVIVVPAVSLVIGMESFRIPYYLTVGSLLLGIGALAVGVLWRAGNEVARRHDHR